MQICRYPSVSPVLKGESPSIVHTHLGIAFIGFEVADDVSAFGLCHHAQRKQQTGQLMYFLKFMVVLQ